MRGCLLISLFLSSAMASIFVDAQDKGQSVERIEVIGQRSLAMLLETYKEQQFALFETFNQLIDDPDMHYLCERRRKVNSRLKVTQCVDAFDKRIRDELFRSEMAKPGSPMARLISAQTSSQQGSMEIDKLKHKKDKLVLLLYEQNERFRNVVSDMLEAKRRYEQAHAAKFGAMSEFAGKQ